MFAILAILAFLAGLFLLAVAWLSGHRTLIPAAVKPIWFWVPGIALVIGAPIVGMLPSVLKWNECSNACTLSAPEVREAYDKCVTGGLDSMAADKAEDEDVNQAQLDAYLAEERPGVEAQCLETHTNRCTISCFDDWWNPQEDALAEAPE